MNSNVITTGTGTTFEKLGKIGQGTYATVYKGMAITGSKKRTVAIKKIKIGAFKDGLDISAIREIKYLNELHHPNVIDLVSVYTVSNNLHLVLEFLEADLEMIIRTKQVVISAGDIKSWMLMLLRGLYHCHRAFVLHRVNLA